MDTEELLQPLLTGNISPSTPFPSSPPLTYSSGQPMDGTTSTDMNSNAEFGGTEARARLESSLLKKLDARMSILILIYILNCAHSPLWISLLYVLRTFAADVDRNNAA